MYIDRDIALQIIDSYANTVTEDGKVIVDAVRDIVSVITPTADVVEVKRGKWILNERDRQRFGKVSEPEDYEHYCSCCNKEALYNNGDDIYGPWWHLSDYCPNCGARMDGDT